MGIPLEKLQIFVSVAVLAYAIMSYSRRKRHLPYPPGPPSEPLIGHVRSLPVTANEETLLKWHKTYGDVLYFSALGRSIILLNSERAAKDLLEERAKIYSDRPHIPLFDLIGWGKTTVHLPYGEEFHKSRKLLQDYIQHQVGDPTFMSIQLDHAHFAMKGLLNSPEEFASQISQFSAGIIVEITYGHRIISRDDIFVELTQKLNKIVELIGRYGAHPVDVFPFLRFLPPWFPGAGFLQPAREMKVIVESMKLRLVEQAERSLAQGIASPSFLSTNLERLRDTPNSGKQLELVNNVAFTLFVTGTETVSTVIENTLFALLLHPDAQRNAQREIDLILGQKRLPNFEDREFIPYIDHVIQESMRWHPAVPLGVPHRLMADDVYQGHRIPKGSFVVSNIRCMTMDENMYRYPTVFYPERFMAIPNGYGEPYPVSAFGFGRRQCPGQRVAEANAWLFVATFLAAFEIVPMEDEDGKPVIPEPKFVQSITSRPLPFKCNIRPRSDKMRVLVEQL